MLWQNRRGINVLVSKSTKKIEPMDTNNPNMHPMTQTNPIAPIVDQNLNTRLLLITKPHSLVDWCQCVVTSGI